jgi:two-component system chemotaxis sensor kinase CheA
MRVDVAKLENLINMVGELALERNRLLQLSRSIETQNITLAELGEQLSRSTTRLSFITEELQTAGLKTRMLPIDTVFRRLPRIVRDLARQLGKEVDLQIQGGETELDRIMAEQLGDPLIHLIRNSMDHGIEIPDRRQAAGKKRVGTIHVEARTEGDHIVVCISDDGAGIDPERIGRKALEKGVVSAEQLRAMERRDILDLIFLPGFSTRDTASDISGRGVGMDVVRRNIQDVGGRITLKSERGRGMTLQLALPLTLAVMDGMVIKVRNETYVLPMSVIVECLRPSNADIKNLMGSSGVLQLRGTLVPLVHLCELLDVGRVAATEERVVIIADAGDGSLFGIIVDELCGHQQVVVKSMEESYGAVPGVAGATILGNGRVALILDVEKLSDLAVNSVAARVDKGDAVPVN